MNSVLCQQKRTHENDSLINKKTISVKDVRILAYKQIMQNKQNYLKRLSYILMEMVIINFKKQFVKKQKQQYYLQQKEHNLSQWIKLFVEKGMKEKIQQHNKQNQLIQIQTLKLMLKLKTCQKQKQLQKCQQCQKFNIKFNQLKRQKLESFKRQQTLKYQNRQLVDNYKREKLKSLQISKKYSQINAKFNKEVKQLQTLIQKLKEKLSKCKQKDAANKQKINNLNNLLYQKQEKANQLQQLLKINRQKTEKLQHKVNELNEKSIQLQLHKQNQIKNKVVLNLQIKTYQQQLIQKDKIIKELILSLQSTKNKTKNMQIQIKNNDLVIQRLKQQNKSLQFRYIGIQQIFKSSQFKHQTKNYLKNKQNNQILKQYYFLTQQLKCQQSKNEAFHKKLEQVYIFKQDLQKELKMISQQKENLLQEIQELNKYIIKKEKQQPKRIFYQENKKQRVSFQQSKSKSKSRSSSCKNNKYKRNDRISTSPSGKLFPYQHEIQSFDQQFYDDLQQFNLIKQAEIEEIKSSEQSSKRNNFKIQAVLSCCVLFQQSKSFQNKNKRVEIFYAQIQVQTDLLIDQFFEIQQLKFIQQKNFHGYEHEQAKQNKQNHEQCKQKSNLDFTSLLLKREGQNVQKIENKEQQKIEIHENFIKIRCQTLQKQIQTIQNQEQNSQNEQKQLKQKQDDSSDSQQQQYEERDSFTQTKQFYLKDKQKINILQQNIIILNQENSKLKKELQNLMNQLKNMLDNQLILKNVTSQLKAQNQNLSNQLNLISQKLKQQQQNNQIIYQQLLSQSHQSADQKSNKPQRQSLKEGFYHSNQQLQIKNIYIKKQIVVKYLKEFLDKQTPWQKRITALDTLSITLDPDQKLITLIKLYKKWQIAKQNSQTNNINQFLQEKDQNKEEFSLKFMKFLTQQEQ